jgi:hypothetical protein
MRYFRYLLDVIRFISLPKEQRSITFYSEGRNYWPHLEGIINELLDKSDLHVCYISSDKNDPGLFIKHARYFSFNIDEGFFRNWLFENIDTYILVMTMPDLNQFQIKKSKNKVHYVYIQHSLVSLHMAYREGAFDHFDTIFCAGPHHIKEIRAMEIKYDLPKKNLVEHGYGRLDSIIHTSKNKLLTKNFIKKNKHALIAPSWGSEGTIESGKAEKLIDQLLELKFKVTLRPHPQTIKFSKNEIDKILAKHKNNSLFNYEKNVDGQESLHASDFMISDWSGAALDYAFGLNKPVFFLDIPRKINNPNYKDIGIEPFESFIRNIVGVIIQDVDNLLMSIDKILPKIHYDKYYFKNSNENGANALKKILNSIPE